MKRVALLPRPTVERLVRAELRPMPPMALLEPPESMLEAPTVERAGEGIEVMGAHLDVDQARALWARLGELLEEGQRARRPRAWADLQRWLDTAFRRGCSLEYRETATTNRGRGLTILEAPRRALIRVGLFQVAHLQRRGSGSWTGPIADYVPGALGVGPHGPDAQFAFTARRVVIAASAMAAMGKKRSG